MKRDRVRNSSLESWQIDAEKLDEGVTAYGLPMPLGRAGIKRALVPLRTAR